GTAGLGIGVTGTQAGSGWGVYGNTPSGIGVHGNSTSGFGVYGQSTSGTGVFGTSNTGTAGFFSNTNAANTANTLVSSSNGAGDGINSTMTGTGKAGLFTVNNAANTNNVLDVTTNGLGRAGFFQVNNAASTADALTATTNGVGASWGFRSTSTGTNGAGLFIQSNAANTANNLQSNQAGLGRAGFFNATNAASNANALEVNTANIIDGAFLGSYAFYARRGAVPAVNAVPTAATTGFFVKQDGNALAGYSQTGIGTFGITNTGVALQATAIDVTGYALNTFGKVQIQGQGAALNRVLTSDAVGNATWQNLGAIGGVTGSGTVNFIPKWTPIGTNLGNSIMFDNGSTVGVGTVTPNGTFGFDQQQNFGQTRAAGTNPGLWPDKTAAGDRNFIAFRTGGSDTWSWGTEGDNNLRLHNWAGGNAAVIYGDITTSRIGVNNTTPQAQLHVTGTGTNFTPLGSVATHEAPVIAINNSVSANTHAGLVAYGTGGTVANRGIFSVAGGSGSLFNIGMGAIANAASTGNNYGVIGFAANGANNWAGAFFGKVQIQDGTEGAGRVFTSDGAGTGSWQTASGAGLVSGSGTLNFIPKWTPNGTTLGNSMIFDNGNAVFAGSSAGGGGSTLNIGLTPAVTVPSVAFYTGIQGFNIHEGLDGKLNFEANQTTALGGDVVMTIDDDGIRGVGIGTTTPSAKLHTVGTHTTTYAVPSVVASASGIVVEQNSAAGANSGIQAYTDGASGEQYAVFGVSGGSSGNNLGGLFLSQTASTGNNFGLIARASGGATNTAALFQGTVQVLDGTQGAGKVFTSDAGGRGSWQDLITPNVGIGLQTLTGPVALPNSTTVPITQWTTITHETGGANYTPVNGRYTITVPGVYQVNASLAFDAPGVGFSGVIDLILNSNVGSLSEATGWIEPHGFGFGLNTNVLRHFNAGDWVSVSALQSSGTATSLRTAFASNNFSVQLIRKD
ncbi:MAG: hypothetical protein ABIR30_09725, partial [Chitinophagaceae bacterium]